MDFRKAVRDPWVWGQLFLFVVVLLIAPLVPRYVRLGDFDYVFNRIDPVWIRSCGAALMVCGAGIAGWGVRSLGPSLTPGVEPLSGAPLVTTGAYAHSRHPIYLGGVLLLAGYTLVWSNWTLALLVGIIALQYFEAKARAEEARLIERHPLYGEYMIRVRRRLL